LASNSTSLFWFPKLFETNLSNRKDNLRLSMNRKIVPPFVTIQIESCGTPIYRQLYEELRRRILSGQLTASSQLPSTRSLAAQLGVSRMTVVTAYDQLLAEGYIEGKSGAGTYVAAVLPEELLTTRNANKSGSKETIEQIETSLSQRGKWFAAVNPNRIYAEFDENFSAFHFGLPAVNEFPFELWSRLTARRFRRPPPEMLGSGSPAGYRPLRETVAAYLQSARAVKCDPEQVIIVAGAQQGLSLAVQILLDTGDVAWLEDPCYLGARNAFACAGAQIVSVPVDQQGFDLEGALEKSPDARMVYVTPSHQFPLGVTMSLARRLALLNWARHANAWIIEDDYDSEFRYKGRPLASLQGLDEAGRVIYVGTFSKTIFPALRLGYMVVPKNLVRVFTVARALADRHSPSIDQAVLTDFIEEGHFARHIRRMRALYAERQITLIKAAERELAGLLDVPFDDAGMNVVGWLPEGVSDTMAAEKASRENIEVAPLSAYCSEIPLRGGLILGYTAFDETAIEAGVKRLAKALSTL
jgi:GntR family transcriptional regulator/MocR family aminotransferase